MYLIILSLLIIIAVVLVVKSFEDVRKGKGIIFKVLAMIIIIIVFSVTLKFAYGPGNAVGSYLQYNITRLNNSKLEISITKCVIYTHTLPRCKEGSVFVIDESDLQKLINKSKD